MGNYRLQYNWHRCDPPSRIAVPGSTELGSVVSLTLFGHIVVRDAAGLLRVSVPRIGWLKRGTNGPRRALAWFRNLKSAQNAAELAT